jgi:RNA polymerase sigma-70 factor (ECF subfamily)
LESAGVAIEAPPPEALAERAESVRTALYLMFNEGYSASSGEALVQPEFCVEAVRLARALAQHPVTAGPASDALAALLALTAARLPTRVGPDGVAQLLEDQPRAQWDRSLIVLGLAHLERSAAGEALTVWHLRAEIASLHATAASAAITDWRRIASIYDHLLALDPSPVVELARAVAVGRAEGATAGLAALPAIEGSPYAEAARGVFLSELGRVGQARKHFAKAMALARTEPERRLMARRLAALSAEPR